MKKTYRLYIDESGDHTYFSLDVASKRYLGLTGCIIEKEYYKAAFHPALEKLKQKHFHYDPDDPVILHRNDIINKRGAFWRLKNGKNLKSFNTDFLKFLEKEQYVIISVVIDKKAHQERYGKAAFHPYHYCIATMLERYCGYLNFYNAQGDVMAESRKGREDRLLKEAYHSIYEVGTQWRGTAFFKSVFTSNEIKIKPKDKNIAGLQLADLLAYPCKQEILLENQLIEDPGGSVWKRYS